VHLLHQLFSHNNIELIRQYLGTYGYGFLFLGTVFEGELILLTAGFLAYLGAMNFFVVLIVAFAGAIFGDNVWFWVGRKGGTHLIEKYGKFFFLTKKRVNRARKYFDTHGPKTIFISRFVFGTRVSTAILAGALGMPQKKFLRSNVAGAASWTIITASLGFLFGKSFQLLRSKLVQTEHALLILAFFAIIIFLLRILFTARDI